MPGMQGFRSRMGKDTMGWKGRGRLVAKKCYRESEMVKYDFRNNNAGNSSTKKRVRCRVLVGVMETVSEGT